ncbi:MAG: disulfide bond formation protein DsbC [Lysobacterales bacterium CG17_big_fil_post_rev_8_21_14_2_50_64_11]|nr:MAG: disulfide bond formation protein DsbC [Xanthomonadales bacterium CG17_big_fil_post_rev_8_21_14_2_50_64_11]PIX60319.1 MAG: disulfide bond formation protein DsbC [Xanthomonadales bacterium CG_4_10_14_3_um_filter_64_11]
MTLRIVAFTLALLSLPALAADRAQEEKQVREALTTLVPGEMKIESIRPAPMPGFYEAVLSGLTVVYVSADGKYLLQGTLLDMAKRENLTEDARATRRRGMLDAVKDDQSIIFSPKGPKYTVTVFTDIDCGYCRRLHQQMGEYNRLGIAVKYLFFPRAGLGSESFAKAVSVWCSPDRQQALTDAKGGATLASGDCENPVARDYQLGRDVGVEGTPAVYSPEGVQLGGYVAPQQLLQRLNELAAAR